MPTRTIAESLRWIAFAAVFGTLLVPGAWGQEGYRKPPAAVRQVVRHGTDGLLVAHDDIAAFSESLVDLMMDAKRRAVMGDAAREVVRRFSLEGFFARWDAVIDAAAEGDCRLLERPPTVQETSCSEEEP